MLVARYRGAVCKLCRADGIKLMLKGKKCLSAKCPLNKRNYPPGMHGQRRNIRQKQSDYGMQLREKQKAKRSYGILERQFRRYFKEAERMRGITGENLIQLLESRLDNVVFRLGFSNSRTQGRQIVRHNHVLVDGKRVNIPSYMVKVGQVIKIKEKSREVVGIQEAIQLRKSTGVHSWTVLDAEALTGQIIRYPRKDEVGLPVKEHLIVELYSK